MGSRLVVVGAGGHGKVVADNALKNGYTDINFVDDRVSGDCMGFPIIGTVCEIGVLNDGKTDFVIGIGDNELRKAIADGYDVNWVTLVHPSAQIATSVSIGLGTVVMAGSAINACTSIGKHCIINTGAVVEHDSIIEDYVHVSPKAALGGTVRVGTKAHIGIGAIVKNDVDISANCLIGAGAVVVKSIDRSGTYVGVPAKEIVRNRHSGGLKANDARAFNDRRGSV